MKKKMVKFKGINNSTWEIFDYPDNDRVLFTVGEPKLYFLDFGKMELSSDPLKEDDKL